MRSHAAHGVNGVKLHSEYELKPPMHREVPIQVETGFQTGQREA